MYNNEHKNAVSVHCSLKQAQNIFKDTAEVRYECGEFSQFGEHTKKC